MSIYPILFVLLISITLQEQINLIPKELPKCYSNEQFFIKLESQNSIPTTFQFQGLPEGLFGFRNGIIQGKTSQLGLFHIFVKIFQQNITTSKSYILHIVLDEKRKYEEQKCNRLILQYPQKFIYTIDQQISFQLKATNVLHRQNPLFTSSNLSPQLSLSSTGLITGSISSSGLYSFIIQCSTLTQPTTTLFLTFNIQPKSYLSKRFLSQVPIKQVFTEKYIQSLYKQQSKASQELFNQLSTVNQKYIIANNKKIQLFSAAQKFTIYENQCNQINKKYQYVKRNSLNSTLLAQQKNRQLQVTTYILELLTYKLQEQVIKPLEKDKQKKIQLEQTYNKSQQTYIESIKNIEEAKLNMSQSQNELLNSIMNRLALQKQYFQAMDNINNKTKLLKKAQDYHQFVSQSVNQAFRITSQAQKTRQQALEQLINLQQQQQISFQISSSSTQKYLQLKKSYNQYKQQLLIQQWQYQLLINKLYIAQARKQSADRASSIALSQGFTSFSQYEFQQFNVNNLNSLKNNKNNLKQTQVNCEAYNYPAIQGVVKVISKKENIITVASGHKVIVGKCTKYEDVKVNQIIYYNGFLINGYVHANTIKKHLN